MLPTKRPRSEDAAGEAPAEFENPHGVEMDESRVVRPVKAYKNQKFLLSHGARTIRILAEHEETDQRLAAGGVKDFVLVSEALHCLAPALPISA